MPLSGSRAVMTRDRFDATRCRWTANNQQAAMLGAQTHPFNPHRRYPWFCKDCGYGQRETLMHDTS